MFYVLNTIASNAPSPSPVRSFVFKLLICEAAHSPLHDCHISAII